MRVDRPQEFGILIHSLNLVVIYWYGHDWYDTMGTKQTCTSPGVAWYVNCGLDCIDNGHMAGYWNRRVICNQIWTRSSNNVQINETEGITRLVLD